MSIFNMFKGTPQEDQIKDLVDKLTGEVTYRVTTKLQDEFVALAEVESATQKVIDLQKQIALLNAEKDNIQEGFARREREIEHKTGLLRQEIEGEKKLAEQEFALRVKQAQLEARETGLVERQAAFGEKMAFIEQRFTEEVGYLKEMVKSMSDRLPDAHILATREL